MPLDAAGQQELRRLLQNGAKRLQLTCPFPEVVDKVRKGTANKGDPIAPKVALLEIENLQGGHRSSSHQHQVATLLMYKRLRCLG